MIRFCFNIYCFGTPFLVLSYFDEMVSLPFIVANKVWDVLSAFCAAQSSVILYHTEDANLKDKESINELQRP
jgi:hypothetical protein